MAKKNSNGQGGKKPTKVVGLDQLGAVISEFKPSIEEGSDSTVLGAAKQFGRDLENQTIEYKRAEKAINKRRVTKELALENLALVEGRVAAIEQDFLTWKQVHAPDVAAISSDEKAAIEAVEEKIFEVKVRHQRMLEAANAMIDRAPEPDEAQPGASRRPDAGSVEMSDEEVDRRIRNIVYARNAWNPELEGAENQRKRWEVVERYTREGGDAFDLAPYFLNAQMEEDFRFFMDDLVPAYRVILAKKDEALQAERANRDAARLAEVKNPLGYLGKAKFWKDDVSGRERNVIMERLAKGDVPDDELEKLVVRGAEDVARLRKQVGEFRGRIVEQLAKQQAERPGQTFNEYVRNKGVWKPEVPHSTRERAIIDFARGNLTADGILTLVQGEEAATNFVETATRFKREEMKGARAFLADIPDKVQSIALRVEAYAAMADGEFALAEIERVYDEFRELEEAFKNRRKTLSDLGESEDDIAKWEPFGDLLRDTRRSLNKQRQRAENAVEAAPRVETPVVTDPVEARTNAVLERKDLWNTDVPMPVRDRLFVGAVDGKINDKNDEIVRAVKNLDAFAIEVHGMRDYLASRGLLEMEVEYDKNWPEKSTEEKISITRANIEVQRMRILRADFWVPGVELPEREALLAAESIPTMKAVAAKLGPKTMPFWENTVRVMAKQLIKSRSQLARLEAREADASSPAASAAPESAPKLEPAVVASPDVERAVEVGLTEREKAIKERYNEVKKMLADDVFWNPSFGGPSNRGVRGAVIARVLKGQAGPKPENLRDPELFAKISAFTSFDDLTAQYNEAVQAYDAELARASAASAAPVEARETPPAAAPEVPPLVVRPPRAVEAAPVALPPRRMSPARPPEAPRSPEVPPVAPPTPRVEARPAPVSRPAPERPKPAPSTSAERYFERARASRFRLEDDDVERPNEPPMRAQEKTSGLAKRATGWLRGLFGRAESVRDAESSTVSPQAQAATGAIAAGGRIFGYSAFQGVTDRIAGISSAERKVIDGAVNRAAAQEREARSAEAALEQRHMANIEMVNRLERTVDAASMPASDKAAMRTRLAELRTQYEADVAAGAERRSAAVAAEVETSSQGSQPSLRARGANFLRERGFMALAEAIGPEGSGRDAGLVARVVAAFRGGFRDVWSRVSPATAPTSDAVRTLGDRVGVESRIAAVEAAALAGSVGGTEMSAEAQRRLQQNIDDLLAALKRGDR